MISPSNVRSKSRPVRAAISTAQGTSVLALGRSVAPDIGDALDIEPELAIRFHVRLSMPYHSQSFLYML